jgi:hypothetical protein
VAIRNQGKAAAERVDVTLAIADAAFLGGQGQAECGPDDLYADEVVHFAPAVGANPDFQEPSAALGPPDFSEEPLKGFGSLGAGGSITLAFADNLAIDGPGNDLRIWGYPGPGRTFYVELSEEGETFESFGLVRAGTDLDLAAIGLQAAWFVRITNDGRREGEGTGPRGADLDAVQALNCLPLEKEPLKLDYLKLLPLLEPGQRETITVPWTASSAGEYTLVVEVDPLDTIAESIETNNRIDRPLRVKE